VVQDFEAATLSEACSIVTTSSGTRTLNIAASYLSPLVASVSEYMYKKDYAKPFSTYQQKLGQQVGKEPRQRAQFEATAASPHVAQGLHAH
jgi:hypothetical protein